MDSRARRPGAMPGSVPGNAHPDSDILFNIAKHLRKRYEIPQGRIKIEHAIRITGVGAEVLGPMTYEEISYVRGLVHTPDVMVVDGEGKPVLIIEQDGKSHDAEGGAERDRMRDGHYKYAGIPSISMKTSAIRSSGATPAEYLDSEMARLGWQPDAEQRPDRPRA